MTPPEPDRRYTPAQLRRRCAHLEACCELSTRLVEATTVEGVSQVTVEAVARASRASAVVLAIPYRFGRGEETRYEHASPGAGGDLPEGLVKSVLAATLAGDAPVWEADAGAFLLRHHLPEALWMRNFVAVPLRLGLIPVGAVLVCNVPRREDLGRVAEELAELVRPVAHAFSHCWFVRTSARDLRILEVIQESADSMLAYLDRDLRFLQVNSAFAATVGLRREQLLGVAITEVMPAAQGLIAACQRALQHKDVDSASEASEVAETATGYWNWRVTPILDDLGAAEGVVVSVLDVTAQVETREKLVEAERTRTRMAEMLNAELNHRIKNNLAMVAGLLRMQLEGLSKEEAGAALISQAIQRLQALAAVHEQLSDTHVGEVEIVEVVRRIAANATKTLGGGRVHVSVAGAPVHCPARAATIVSVVTNELITNALKHGSSGEGGPPSIAVSIGREGGELRLGVWNSGGLLVGERSQLGPQLGLRLVEELVGQCEGRFALTPQQGGVLAEVVLEEARLQEDDEAPGAGPVN